MAGHVGRTWMAALLLGFVPAGTAIAQDGASPVRLLFTLPAAARATTLLGYEGTATGQALTATSDDPLIRLLVARAARDTALVRDLVTDLAGRFEQLGARNAPPPVLLVEADLWAGDTASARARLEVFAARAPHMDGATAWDGIANAEWLPRVRQLRARLDARPRPGVNDSATVRFRVAAPGTWRFRYDMALWTRIPVALPASDSAAPIARLALLVHETLDSAGTLSRAVEAAALDVPLFARLGDDGLAAQRALVGALLAARDRVVPDQGMRTATEDAADDGSADDRWTRIAAAVLASLHPLGLMPSAPGGDVRPGDTWSDTITVRVPGTVLDPPLRIAATMRLAAVRENDGMRTAVLTQSAHIRHAVLPDGSTVDLTLTAETVVDLDAGVPVRTAASLRAQVCDPRGAAIPVRVLITALRQPAPAPGLVVAAAP